MSDHARLDLRLLAGLWALLAAYAALSWAQWPLLTADSARELYVPFQILAGATIYADFYYLYGPVAPYLQAGLLSLFGARLEVLYIASLLQLAAIMGLLYAVARQLLNPWPAACVVWLFFTHFALGRDIWGYVWPYAFAATFSVLWGLLLLLALLRHQATGRLGWLVLAGLALGLALVTKLEYGAAAAALGGLYGLFRLQAPGSPSAKAQDALALVVPAMAVAGAVALAVLSQVAWPTVRESIWPSALMALWNSGGAWHGSFASWAGTLRVLALDGGVLGLVVGHEAIARSLSRSWPARLVALLVLALLILWVQRGGAGFWLTHAREYWMGPGFLLLFGLLAVVGWRILGAWREGRPAAPRDVAWTLVGAYACLVAVRSLMLGYNDYTRYQAPVALVAWVALAGYWLPGVAQARGWLSDLGHRRAQGLVAGLALVLGLQHLATHTLDYRQPDVAVSGPAGTVMAEPRFGLPFNQALAFLRGHLKPDERFVAAPMEASLYLFTGRPNVLKEDQLFWGYLTTPEAQAGAIARMQAGNVRFMLVSNYRMGHQYFGVTYMQDLGRFLRERGRVVAVYGSPEPGYQLTIYELPPPGSRAAW